MSVQNIRKFYLFLEENPDVRKEALEIQNHFSEQEQVINEFILLAVRNGFPFTIEEYMSFLYERAEFTEKKL